MDPDLLNAVRNMKQQGQSDAEITNGLVDQYPLDQIRGCLAVLKNMQPDKLTAGTKEPRIETHNRVVERHPQLRLWAIAPLAPLLIMFPYMLGVLTSFANILPRLVQHHDASTLATTGLYVWSVIAFGAALATSIIILTAKKETTITRWIYSVIGIEAVFILSFTILSGSLILLVFGFFQLYFYWWISRKIGVLSQL